MSEGGCRAVNKNPILGPYDEPAVSGALEPPREKQGSSGGARESAAGNADSDTDSNADSELDEVALAVSAEADDQSSPVKQWISGLCGGCLQAQVLEVMLIMIGVGSDNVAIYMVIFAVDDVHEIVLTVLVFYMLLLVNIFVAACLMRCRSVATCFQKYVCVCVCVCVFIAVSLPAQII